MFRIRRFRKTKYKGGAIVDGLKHSIYGPKKYWPSNERMFHFHGTLEDIAKSNGLSYYDPRTAHLAMLELLKQGNLQEPATLIRDL